MSKEFVSKSTTIHMYYKKQVDKKKPFLLFLTYVKERRWGFICYVMKFLYNYFFRLLQDQRHIKNINSIVSMDMPIFTCSKILQSMGKFSSNFLFHTFNLQIGRNNFQIGHNDLNLFTEHDLAQKDEILKQKKPQQKNKKNNNNKKKQKIST